MLMKALQNLVAYSVQHVGQYDARQLAARMPVRSGYRESDLLCNQSAGDRAGKCADLDGIAVLGKGDTGVIRKRPVSRWCS